MPPVSKEKLREHTRNRSFEPVYVLYGPEVFLRETAAKYIADTAFEEGELRDFNEDTFDLDDPANIINALAAAQQLPMMARRRIVRVTGARVAATSQKDTLKEEYLEAMAAYLADPSPHTIFLINAEELNGNRKMAVLLKEKAASVEFTALGDSELLAWVRKRVEGYGIKADPAALKLLVTLVGADLHRLGNEADKLASAADEPGGITIELVEALVANTRESSNFDLTDHLVAGRREHALAALKKTLDDGAEPLALLGLVSYNLRRMLIAKDMMASGAPADEVGRAIKVRYSDREPFLASSRRAERAKLRHCLRRLAAVDLAIKTSLGGSGPKGSRLQFEMLFCEIALAE
jgi:DNA polymerase III subunit delta